MYRFIATLTDCFLLLCDSLLPKRIPPFISLIALQLQQHSLATCKTRVKGSIATWYVLNSISTHIQPSLTQSQLPHVHLISTYGFPQLPALHPDKVAEWLLAAPKIARDQATFYWTYLDRPVDGTILLVWQSINALGTDFPSDGYIWAPAETAFQLEVSGGYVRELQFLRQIHG